MSTFTGFNILKNGYGQTFQYNSVYSHDNFFPMFKTEDSKNGFKLYLDLEPWKDKRILVIGDSFSAPGTWQAQMCANFYAVSDNHSISGGGWCNGRAKTVYQLAQEVTTRPDIVIICMGTNDVNDDNVTIGEFVNGTSVSDYSDATWIGGIQKALTYIRNQWTGVPVYVGFTPGGGLYNAGKWERQKTYIDAMRELCVLYSCVYIETRTCGKAYPLVQNDLVFNTSTSDGHPSSEGQAQIARYMTDLMSGYKAQRAWYNPS
jgi:lysophospholipase L1-like esterase